MVLNLKNFIELTIPHYLIIVLISPLAAFLVINQQFPNNINILMIIGSLSLAVLGFNTLNMVFDLNIDKIDKPKRPLPNGQVTLEEAKYLAIVLLALSLVSTFLVNNFFTLLIIGFIIVAYFYSAPQLYIKKYWWGSTFTGMVLYGIIPFLSAASISSNEIPIIFLIFFVALFSIISNIKDFEDTVGEEKNKIKSLPLILGTKNTTILILATPILLTISMGGLATLNIIPQKFLYAAIISTLFLISSTNIIWKEIRKITYQNIIFKELKSDRTKEIITQSNAVTLTVIITLMVQITFALVSII